MKISGFTIVRNAEKLSYPFLESVISALPLCDEFIINCGDSDDNTLMLCEELKRQSPDKIKIIQSKWLKHNQTGGYQLKAQTDYALSQCQYSWVLYLQADEVLHEADQDRIREAIVRAEKRPEIDGVLFDYLHFYGGYDYQITGRNWYRREVRIFKNNRGISAYRDAQGFRKDGNRLNVIESGAKVFHYGYVRTAQSLQKKSEEMGKWWGQTTSTEESDFQLRRHFGLRKFTGNHPGVMMDRIDDTEWDFDPTQCPRKWDGNELKNLVTFLWESIVPYRIGEFRNYEIK